MGSLEKRISKLEERVKGDEIETFEDLQWEIHAILEADKTGKEYVPRPLSEEVARTLEAALEELRQDPNFAHIFDDDAQEIKEEYGEIKRGLYG